MYIICTYLSTYKPHIYTHHIPGSWNTSNRYWCRRNTQPPQRSPGWILDGRAQNAARRSRTTWSLLEHCAMVTDGPMKKADGKWWAMARMGIVERWWWGWWWWWWWWGWGWWWWWWWWWWTIDEELMKLMGDSEWSCVETGWWCNCNGDKAYPDPWAWHILDICLNRHWGYPKWGKASLGL